MKARAVYQTYLTSKCPCVFVSLSLYHSEEYYPSTSLERLVMQFEFVSSSLSYLVLMVLNEKGEFRVEYDCEGEN